MKKINRPISYHLLIAISCICFALFFNGVFFEYIQDFIDKNGRILTTSILAGAIFLITFLALELITFRFYAKFIIGLVWIISIISFYYAKNLGISFNAEIIHSVLNTNKAEANDFLNAKDIIILGFSLLAVLFIIYKIKLKKLPFKTAAIHKTIILITTLIAIAALYLTAGQKIIFAVKSRSYSMNRLIPIAPIRAIGDHIIYNLSIDTNYKTLGLDAKTNAKGLIGVLIIGESARAANYPFSGYERNTMPYTPTFNPIIFKNFSSCGVITAVSVPCMLSAYNQNNFNNPAQAEFTDFILDVALRAGYEVFYVSNNGGYECIGKICKGIKKQNLAFYGGEDLDEIMLPQIDKIIKQAESNTFLIIHLQGSHGARYDKKYPKEFELFTPVCQNPNLAQCEKQSIINAYDNSLIYTDFVISKILKSLESKQNFWAWYVSDHGESLGELGQYMHGGFPRAFAPNTQTHIPSMIFLNDSGEESINNKKSKLRKNLESRINDSLNHDVIFHTILNLLDIKTSDYDKSLDISQ